MREDFRRLRKFFSLFRSQWAGYGISSAMVSFRNLIITWLTAFISSRVISVVSGDSSINLVYELLLFLLLLFAFCLFDSLGIYAQQISIQKICNQLRRHLYHGILNTSIPETERFGQRSELISRVNRDVDTASSFLSNSFIVFIMYTISGIGATVIIARESRAICIGLYVLGIIGFFLNNSISKKMRTAYSSMQKDTSDGLSVFMQTISQSPDLRMANLVDAFSALFAQKMLGFRKHSHTYSRLSGTSGAFNEVIQFLGFFGVIGGCMYFYSQGTMSLASVVMLTQMSSLILTMTLNIYASVTSIHTSLVGIERLFEVIELPKEYIGGTALSISDPGATGTLVRTIHAACRFRNGNIAFSDLNISIPASRMVAVSGDSGSGKTTLMRLLLKLYPYTGGSITLLGQEVRDCSVSSIRQAVGYVPQDNVIFSGTLRDNILIGNEYGVIDDAQISEVLDGIGATDWVFALEKGLDTSLSEGGQNLSGGQRQMIALARAILYQRSILILDEAFAGVDTAHIKRILQYMRTLPNTKSTLIITHDAQVEALCDEQIEIG